MAKFEESLQGKLILDSGKLAGSYFDRSVILICRHNEEGGFGLVLNRPLKQKLGTSVNDPLAEELARSQLFEGGPVQPGFLSCLRETDLQPDFEILPSLILGHSLDDLKEAFATNPKRFRIFVGYAGWTGGQLENEIKSGCWLALPASVALVFHPQPETLWRQVLLEKGGFYRLIAECPENPSLN